MNRPSRAGVIAIVASSPHDDLSPGYGTLHLAGHALRQRHRVSGRGSDHAIFSACVADHGLQLADRLVIPDVLDLDACGNRLSDSDGLDETPVGFEKHRARP